MDTEKLGSVLGELHHRFKTLYGERLVQMILYGSQARDDAERGSDIDILVVLGSPVNPGEEIYRTSEAVASLSLKHDVVVSCLFISVERFEHEKNPLLLNVRREGVPIV
jgi:predicted nucleotidyltransferase